MAEIPRGRFSWYELMTTDPEGAQSFYRPVVGWGTQAWEESPMPYTMWMNGEVPVGGVMKLPDDALAAGAPSSWTMYVATPSVDDTAARAQELGGSVVWGPMDIEGVGRMVGLADPQGAHFALHQPPEPPSVPEHPAEVLEVSWHELLTTDWEAAYGFYVDLFGWQKADDMDMGEMGIYRMFSRGAHPLGGMMNKPPMVPVCYWLLYMRVADLDASLAMVNELGGQVLNGPMEVPGGDRVAQCMDPQGAAFALHEVKSA